ncbi:TIGR00341 family protein [Stenotrophomonas sp.]|uniref:TIGR00341 family protein n=1 Tax=Stenotrophomonas sp. TaxID=69392 RepID=UPI0028A0CF81|nr:TIGR00341 family protein [Stenotrophomonas sp.]
MRAQRRWQRLRSRRVQHVEHAAVIDNVADAGGLSPRFAFMAVMSCGIAILGLLQSSAAVVIGAMLISPLMGPIVQLGFSLCVVDFRMMGRALLALLAGVLLALATAMCIVWLSPLREATSEILARTQPTLFDLLVAMLSGLAGGYAVITRKGEAIVGVAIATALMPPLAVVAFGLATGDLGIAGGAFFLFMTNLLAIALSVTLIAKWYGFGMDNSPKHTAWQAIVIASTFVLLALPLGLALRNIGEQTWTANQTRSVVQKYLQERGGSIEQLRVERHGQGYSVDLVAMVPTYIGHAQAELGARLAARLPAPPTLRVRQTLEANDDGRRDRADLEGLRLRVNALTEQTRQLRAEADAWTLEHVRALLGDITAEVMLDGMQRRVVVTLTPPPAGTDAVQDAVAIAALRQRLAAVTPGWTIVVVEMRDPAPAIAQTANASDSRGAVSHALLP